MPDIFVTDREGFADFLNGFETGSFGNVANLNRAPDMSGAFSLSSWVSQTPANVNAPILILAHDK